MFRKIKNYLNVNDVVTKIKLGEAGLSDLKFVINGISVAELNRIETPDGIPIIIELARKGHLREVEHLINIGVDHNTRNINYYPLIYYIMTVDLKGNKELEQKRKKLMMKLITERDTRPPA